MNYSVTIARDTQLEPWDRGCMAQRALRALLHEKQNGGRRKERDEADLTKGMKN